MSGAAADVQKRTTTPEVFTRTFWASEVIWNQLQARSENGALCIFSPWGFGRESPSQVQAPLVPCMLKRLNRAESSRASSLLKAPALPAPPPPTHPSPEETLTSCPRARHYSLMFFVFLKRRGLPQLHFLSPFRGESGSQRFSRELSLPPLSPF